MCTLQVLRSIGYRAPPLEGVPYEPTMRTIPNIAGRVTQSEFQLTSAFSYTIFLLIFQGRVVVLFQVSVLWTLGKLPCLGIDCRHVCAGLYCSGWVRTGPVGAVMNTMSSAYETAENIIQDHKDGKYAVMVRSHGTK